MSERTIKSGGVQERWVAGVLAAALFILSAVTDTVAPIDVDYDSPNEYVYVAASTVAFLAVVVTVIGFGRWPRGPAGPARLATVAEVYGIAVSRKGSQCTCSRTRRWFGTCSR